MRRRIHIQKAGNRRHDDRSLEGGNRMDWRNMHPYARLREQISSDPISKYIGFRAIQEQMLCDEAEPRAWKEHRERHPELFEKLALASGNAAVSSLNVVMPLEAGSMEIPDEIIAGGSSIQKYNGKVALAA